MMNKENTIANNDLSQNTATTPMNNYNNASQFQADVNEPGNKLLTENAFSLSKKFPNEIHIADFGCSHGKNSMTCIKAVLDGYIEVKEPISVLVYLNDLPSNDFDEVNKCLNNPEISYHEHPLFNINKGSIHSTEFNKNSFYKKILPDNSLHLGFSFNCLHWKEKSVELSQGLFPGSTMTTPEEKNIIASDAQRELNIFLRARYQELKSKGRLVINIYKESNFLEHFDSNWHNYIKSKGVQKHQLKKVTIPNYFRSTIEIDSVLNNFKDEFKVLSSQSQLFTSLRFNYNSLKSVFFNVLVKGMKETNLFTKSMEVENFVEGFILSYSDNQLNFNLEMQFLTLEKI